MKRLIRAAWVLTATLPLVAGAATTTWDIDPAHSAVEFAIKHMAVSTVRGQFSNIKGNGQPR